MYRSGALRVPHHGFSKECEELILQAECPVIEQTKSVEIAYGVDLFGIEILWTIGLPRFPKLLCRF